MMLHRRLLGLMLPVILCVAAPAWAHKPSDAYLTLSPDGDRIGLRWDIALRDLDREIALDADDDGRLSWGEVRTRWGEIERYAFARLSVQAAGRPCEVNASGPPLVDRHSDGSYVVLTRTLLCARGPLTVEYRLFADSDPTHRGILRVEGQDGGQTLVLEPGAAARSVAMQTSATALQTLAEFIAQGMWHIAIGADHIFFLLSLLLVAVLVRAPDGWLPAAALKPALWDVLRIVTAFTVAHSITLALAVLGVWNPPSRWIESLIALSVLLAALNNLRPIVRESRWILTFGFGLIHGFGFAGALKDLGLGGGSLAWPLLGFNLGVELGQLLIVLIFVPLAWTLRPTRLYRRGVLTAGSSAIALLASVWLAERALDLDLLRAVL